ncbi:ABC transporter permease [Vagococcus sp.]|uniref:ABC transporter permease n=1 Tax=Vagococcus sp. TaxID=1933889 RepID=UPI003F9C01AB
MNKFWVVALETYKKHVKTVSFITMVLAPFLLIAISLGGGYFASKLASTDSLAVVSELPEIREGFMAQGKNDFDFDKKINTIETAQKALKEDDIDGYLSIKKEGDVLVSEFVSKDSLGMDDQQKFQSYLNNMQISLNSAKLDLSSAEVATLFKTATIKDRQVNFENNKMTNKKSNRMAMTMVGFFVVLAMYMIVILYSSITAQEVASEKGTRIMEVILSSTTAAKHFYGKIVGISLVILTQVSIYLIAGIGAYLFAKDTDFVSSMLKDLPLGDLVKGLLGYNLLFLLFGVLIYTILSAFMGSLVTRSEDAPKAAAPVTYLIMVASLPVLMLGTAQPDHLLIKIFSYIPFFSSFSMPIRIANDSVMQWEIVLSLGLLIVAIAILLKVAARVYKSTVLIYSDKGMFQVFKEAVRIGK